MRRLQPQVWVGDSRLDLASLDFQPLDQPAGRVAATRLRLVTHQWQQPDPALQTIGLDLASDNLTVDGLQLGPSRYAMELRNIDIQSYSTLQQQLQAVRQAGLTPEEQSQRAAFVVLAALPGLLERHPELAITHLDSDTPQGPLRASLKVAYTGDGPPPMAAPAALLLQLKARADLQLPKPMVSALMRRRIAQQVSTHARQAGETPAPEELARRTDAALQAELELVTREGWLRADERTYRTQLSFDRGRLTVNGADGGALLNLLGH